MHVQRSLFPIVLLISLIPVISACSPASRVSPATATAQTERIQKLATKMASASQATSAVSQQQATDTTGSGLQLLNEAQNWRLVISDTFDTNSNDWPIGKKDGDLSTEQISIDKGGYYWTATAKDGFVYWTTPITDSVKDFYLAVDAGQINGPEDGEVSLVFHQADTSNFFLFEVNSQKQFMVSQLVEDAWQTPIFWTDSSVIQPFQVNQLAVIAKEPDYYFFINGSLVGTYTEPNPTTGSPGVSVGLYHKGDTANFVFDNFVFRVP